MRPRLEGTEPSLDVALAVRGAHLAGATYHSSDASEGRARLEAELVGQWGMELVRELRSSTDDEYGYVALDAKDNALHVVFRGSCTLGNVLTDLNYEDHHGEAQRQYVAHLTGGRAAGGHAAGGHAAGSHAASGHAAGGHAASGHAARSHAARGHAARDVDVAREMILHRGFAEAYLAIRHEMFERLMCIICGFVRACICPNSCHVVVVCHTNHTSRCTEMPMTRNHS